MCPSSDTASEAPKASRRDCGVDPAELDISLLGAESSFKADMACLMLLNCLAKGAPRIASRERLAEKSFRFAMFDMITKLSLTLKRIRRAKKSFRGLI